MVADIGSFIFVDLLGMTMYPGYPFTGIIVRDAIQFLFIPSVFIVLVIYMLVGRLAVPGHKIRIMIAVSAYLFIITGGYYKVFALLAGPYFIFLIFILGLLYFIPAHFGGIGDGHASYSYNRRALRREEQAFEREVARADTLAEEAYGWAPNITKHNPFGKMSSSAIKKELKDLDKRIEEFDKKEGGDRALIQKDMLIDRKLKLERILGKR